VAALQREVAEARAQAFKFRVFVFWCKVCLVGAVLVLVGMSAGYIVAVHKLGAGCVFSGVSGGFQY